MLRKAAPLRNSNSMFIKTELWSFIVVERKASWEGKKGGAIPLHGAGQVGTSKQGSTSRAGYTRPSVIVDVRTGHVQCFENGEEEFLVLFLVLSCIGGYSLWRRWHPALSRCWCFCCCCRSSGELGDEDPNSEQESTRSCCPPPHYSRCSSFRHAPPPYTEVTSKPDLYPLVISYGDSGKTGPGSSYLMVQYFRNYIVRPVGHELGTLGSVVTLQYDYY
uniref:WW domain binding protein VOPP1 n=1 Tax=Timema cristinae TaxID=61476 RepID=A0A7R9D8D7_TIMCR|nr:unnamed protein product [Timema cristinae]